MRVQHGLRVKLRKSKNSYKRLKTRDVLSGINKITGFKVTDS